jgi:hypothetical protein
VLLSNMMLSSGGPALTERGATAKAEAYRDGLDDVPAWAVAAAVRAWRRGECGDRNYEFAPSAATLREVCLGIMRPYQIALARLDDVLNAMTIEEAMDSKPIDGRAQPRLRVV